VNSFRNELSTLLALFSGLDFAVMRVDGKRQYTFAAFTRHDLDVDVLYRCAAHGVPSLIAFPEMPPIGRCASTSKRITNSWSTVPAVPALIEVSLGVCWR